MQTIECKEIYFVDVDGTICTQTNGDYKEAQPLKERIEKLNKLYDEGYCIIYHTARGMNRFDGDIESCYTTYYDFTENQLREWGVKFHDLILGKPYYDHWIDDKAMNSEEFFK